MRRRAWRLVRVADAWLREVYPWVSLCALAVAWWLQHQAFPR